MLLPSQNTLIASVTVYPLILWFLTGSSPTPRRLSQSIKATSTLHSALTTALALYVLKQPDWRTPTPDAATHLSATSFQKVAGKGGYPDDTYNPLISARSEFANAITALEAGYLLQDSVALLLDARTNGGYSKALDKTLLTHHVGIGTALLVLHYYIARGREAGIYIIVMFLLMNSSTPVLNLRWYLRNSAKYKKRKELVLLVDLAFVAAFFVARVWLVWKILKEYGRFHGMGAWQTYWIALRVPCKLGTGALWTANLGWLVLMVGNLAGRSKTFTLGGQ